jgi:hypothetical protein
MFSVQQKREISDAVQKILRSTMHPELPTSGEVSFTLHVNGAEEWSYADIKNNAAVGDPGVNPHNELMASMPEEKARDLIEEAQDPSFHSAIPYTPDPRVHPDEMMQEMIKQQLSTLTQRIYKAEAIIIDYNKRLGKLQERDEINRKLYSELRFGLDNVQEFLTPIIEDNLIAHHDDQLRNIMTAIRQLGNPQINKTLGGG